MSTSTNAIAYVRRSQQSTEKTVSLADQEARVRAYIEAQGWKVAAVLVDDGISGGKRGRFDRIRQAVAEHRASAVVVYNLDRFARDVAGLLDELKGFSRKGVALHVVGRGRVETESASGFLTTSIEGVLAEHYRKVISEKTRDALSRLRSQGRRWSRLMPYGWTAEADGRLVEVADEQETICRAVAFRSEGLSLRAVAARLAADGRFARNGKPFSAKVLRDVVTSGTLGNSRMAA
ncbi:MAG: recombinase family protein [Deltaproteobacteria bacterium]